MKFIEHWNPVWNPALFWIIFTTVQAVILGTLFGWEMTHTLVDVLIFLGSAGIIGAGISSFIGLSIGYWLQKPWIYMAYGYLIFMVITIIFALTTS